MHSPSPVSARLESDPVVEAYKVDIDRSLLRENLQRSPTERVERLQRAVHAILALKQSRRASR